MINPLRSVDLFYIRTLIFGVSISLIGCVFANDNRLSYQRDQHQLAQFQQDQFGRTHTGNLLDRAAQNRDFARQYSDRERSERASLRNDRRSLRSNPASKDHELARVVSVEPLYETRTISVPREACYESEVIYRDYQQQSALGPAVLGGVLGASLDRETHIAGAVLGATLGASFGQRPRTVEHRQVEQRCEQRYERQYEELVVGYDVTYELDGRQYQTQTTSEPGNWLPVEVSVRPVY